MQCAVEHRQHDVLGILQGVLEQFDAPVSSLFADAQLHTLCTGEPPSLSLLQAVTIAEQLIRKKVDAATSGMPQ